MAKLHVSVVVNRGRKFAEGMAGATTGFVRITWPSLDGLVKRSCDPFSYRHDSPWNHGDDGLVAESVQSDAWGPGGERKVFRPHRWDFCWTADASIQIEHRWYWIVTTHAGETRYFLHAGDRNLLEFQEEEHVRRYLGFDRNYRVACDPDPQGSLAVRRARHRYGIDYSDESGHALIRALIESGCYEQARTTGDHFRARQARIARGETKLCKGCGFRPLHAKDHEDARCYRCSETEPYVHHQGPDCPDCVLDGRDRPERATERTDRGARCTVHA
jgi:hypothetical protein